jgi:hypothetical protein
MKIGQAMYNQQSGGSSQSGQSGQGSGDQNSDGNQKQ